MSVHRNNRTMRAPDGVRRFCRNPLRLVIDRVSYQVQATQFTKITFSADTMACGHVVNYPVMDRGEKLTRHHRCQFCGKGKG